MFKDMYQHVCIFPPLSCVAFCQLHTHSDTDAGDNNNSYWHLSQLQTNYRYSEHQQQAVMQDSTGIVEHIA